MTGFAKQTEFPHNLETEQAVLCCLFMAGDSEETAQAMAVLKEEDFFGTKNKILFQACQKAMKQNSIIDLVTVSDILKEQNEFEKAGGMDYITETAMCVSNTVGLRDYIKILQQKSYFRRKIQQGREIMEAGFSQNKNKILEILQNSQQDGIVTQRLEAIPDVLGEYLKKLEKQRQSGKLFSGLPTGFTDLDLYTGGLQEGNLIVVAARPAMGKTALALDFLRNAAKHMDKDTMAIFFSLEMDRDKIAARMFSGENGVDNSIFSLRMNDEDKWLETLQNMQKNAERFEKNTAKIYIDDNAGTSLEEIYEKCHSQQIATGKKLGLVVVDYLQIIGGKRTDNRAIDVAYNTMGLKNIARQFQCPVVVLSQLSRENEKRADKRPALSDLRDSGAIEQDADIVLLLYREKYYFPHTEKENRAEVIVAKNRNGATGVVELVFLENCTTFRNKANL